MEAGARVFTGADHARWRRQEEEEQQHQQEEEEVHEEATVIQRLLSCTKAPNTSKNLKKMPERSKIPTIKQVPVLISNGYLGVLERALVFESFSFKLGARDGSVAPKSAVIRRQKNPYSKKRLCFTKPRR